MVVVRGGDGSPVLATLLDPSAYAEVEEQANLWTPREKAVGVLQMTTPLAVNRLLWTFPPLLLLGVVLRRVRRERLALERAPAVRGPGHAADGHEAERSAPDAPPLGRTAAAVVARRRVERGSLASRALVPRVGSAARPPHAGGVGRGRLVRPRHPPRRRPRPPPPRSPRSAARRVLLPGTRVHGGGVRRGHGRAGTTARATARSPTPPPRPWEAGWRAARWPPAPSPSSSP